jgi:hypothetical protein
MGSLACVAAGVVIRQGAGVALLAVALGLLLIGVAWRPKGEAGPGAVYSASADLLSDAGGHLPGQLSISADSVVWTPTAYSRRHGADVVTLARDGSTVSLDRGPALLDVIVAVSETRGPERRFLTRRSGALRRALGPTTDPSG